MPQPDWGELERRVARLEKLAGVAEACAPAPTTEPPAETEHLPLVNSTALLPIMGRALLGLAGAYLLRALTESAAIPPTWGVAAGILYAIFWLFRAVQPSASSRTEAAIQGLTAVLVLCPLLWESTLRFHAISTWIAAALLVTFVVFGLAVSWRKNLLVVATIVILAGLGTASGLLLATHDVVPFTLVFLAIAAAVEISSCLEHWLSERWLAALAADLAVLLATWLVTREHGLPAGYPPIPYGWLLGVQVTLLVIYLASTMVRTLLRGLTFTWFEMAQCAAAFLIGVGGGLQLPGAASTIVAAFALACAAACYLVSFVVLDHAAGRGRNFYTYSTFGILLVLAGIRILLAGLAASVAWSVLALACIWAGSHFARLTLQVHGGIYLVLALSASGALYQAAAFSLGSAHWSGDSPQTVWAGLIIAAICYLMMSGPAQSARLQMFRLAVAGILAWLLAGALASALTAGCHSALGALAGHPYCATLRTAVLVGLALVLAWTGARWSRTELSRLIYPAMILGAYRLTMVDFAQDHKPALFLSLLVYGGALMALPRLARVRGAS